MTGVRKRIMSIPHSMKRSEICKTDTKPQPTIRKFAPLETLLNLWEENAHRGGQKLGEVTLPAELLQNDSIIWEDPELVKRLMNGIFLH